VKTEDVRVSRASERSHALGALALGLVIASALAACSNKNGTPYPAPPPTGSDAAVTGAAGLGGGGITGSGFGGRIGGLTGAAGFDAGAPSGTVTIAIQSPTMGAILSSNAAGDVAAKVTITGGTDVVDPATVRVALVSGMVTVSAAPLVGPSGDNLYTGKISLAGLATGDYTLVVSARSSTNAAGAASVTIKIDGGPVITVLSPLAGHHYKGSLVTQVVIDPGSYPVATDIAASIAGMALTLQPAGPTNVYRAVFDLTMPTALTGDQLFEVSAKDMRGTRTDIKLTFNVDVTGPAITTPLPVPGAIVGGVIKISASVADDAGIDDSSVQVLIGDATTTAFHLPLTPDATTPGVYSALFDTNNLTKCLLNTDPCIVRPTLSFRAADALGNQTTVSYEIAIDNIPPIADLDPPNIRITKTAMGVRCSHAFDPLDRDVVAGDMPNDLCVVPQMFDLRARIEDDGNHATGLKQIPISTVDPDATAAYILDTTVLNGVAQPLVVDTDGDGWCDAVNPTLQPTTEPLTGPRQVLKVRLKPVPPGGAADFTPDATLPIPGVCVEGSDMDGPEPFCRSGLQPTVAITYATGLPAIWSVEPIAPADPLYCFGAQFDTKANNVAPIIVGVKQVLPSPAGWKCIAVVTADMLGNASTSAPLRVYLKDYSFSGMSDQAFCAQTVPVDAGPPPSCTGTFDRKTGLVSQQACKTRSFKPAIPGTVELCDDKNDCGIVSEFH
jgi:hypothetical protein